MKEKQGYIMLSLPFYELAYLTITFSYEGTPLRELYYRTMHQSNDGKH